MEGSVTYPKRLEFTSRHCWKIVSDASCTLWKASVQRLQVWFKVLRNWPYSSEEFNWAAKGFK